MYCYEIATVVCSSAQFPIPCEHFYVFYMVEYVMMRQRNYYLCQHRITHLKADTVEATADEKPHISMCDSMCNVKYVVNRATLKLRKQHYP